MSDGTNAPSKGGRKVKGERLAAALRDNLRRRKTQARAKVELPPEPGRETPPKRSGKGD